MMMKKKEILAVLVSAGLLVSMAGGLTGCGDETSDSSLESSSENDAVDDSDAVTTIVETELMESSSEESTESDMEEAADTVKDGEELGVSSVTNFLNGRALVETGQKKLIIDTDGNIIYDIESPYECDLYEDYMHIYYIYGVDLSYETMISSKMIDLSTGDITFSYENSENEAGTEFLAYGNGYHAISEQETGFSNSENITYSIVDPCGNALHTFTKSIDDSVTIRYAGASVFHIESGEEEYYYNAETEMQFSFDDSGSRDLEFSDSGIAIGYNNGTIYYSDGSYDEGLEYTYDRACVISNNSVGWSKDSNSFGVRNEGDMPSYYANDIVIYLTGNDIPHVYNVNTKSDVALEDLEGHSFLVIASSSEEQLVFFVQGDDGNVYYMLTDIQGNTIEELTMLESTIFSEFKSLFSYKLYANDESVYFVYEVRGEKLDLSDGTVYELDNNENYLIEAFYDGWAISSAGVYNYINESGELMFDVVEGTEYDYAVIYVDTTTCTVFDYET